MKNVKLQLLKLRLANKDLKDAELKVRAITKKLNKSLEHHTLDIGWDVLNVEPHSNDRYKITLRHHEEDKSNMIFTVFINKTGELDYEDGIEWGWAEKLFEPHEVMAAKQLHELLFD